VCEALTNAAKHAHASAAQVDVAADDTHVRLSVSDDGWAAPIRPAGRG
jgi:signal transduction histidine kinase